MIEGNNGRPGFSPAAAAQLRRMRRDVAVVCVAIVIFTALRIILSA
jgi:hypothetical protein